MPCHWLFSGFLGFLVFSFSGFLVPLAASFWPGRVFYVLRLMSAHTKSVSRRLCKIGGFVRLGVPDLKDWRLCKAAPPERCDPSKVQKHLFQNSAMVTSELQRAHVQKALLEVAMEHKVSEEELAFTSHPNQVYEEVQEGRIETISLWHCLKGQGPVLP